MSRNKETHVRINKRLRDELKLKFPHNKMSELIQVMYDTSLLKIEGKLRKRRKKKK